MLLALSQPRITLAWKAIFLSRGLFAFFEETFADSNIKSSIVTCRKSLLDNKIKSCELK